MSTEPVPPHLKDIGPPPGLCPIPLHKPQLKVLDRRSSISSYTESSRSITTPSPFRNDTNSIAQFKGASIKLKEEFSSPDLVHTESSLAHQLRRTFLPTNLDVTAPPFVPKGLPPFSPNKFLKDYNMAPNSTFPPPPISLATEERRVPPSWYQAFRAGWKSTDPDIRERYGLTLIQSVETIWDSKNVNELAQYFCMEALQPSCDINLLGQFAWKLHKIFDRIPGSDTPLLFLRHLECIVLEAFIDRWGNSRNLNDVDDEYVASSHTLSKFVAKLFALDLIHREAAKEALAVLFNGGLDSSARVGAAENMLYNLTSRFWVGYENQIFSIAKYLYIEKTELKTRVKAELARKLQPRLDNLISYLLDNRTSNLIM